MQTFISLIRGINVGGHKKIKMAELREHYADLGFQNIRSYIQTGNLLFETKKTDKAEIIKMIEEKIVAVYGFEAKVILRTLEEYDQALANNPFLEKQEDLKKLIVMFAGDPIPEDWREKLPTYPNSTDEIAVIGSEVYLHCPDGYRDTKYGNSVIEKKLKIHATARNWRSAMKIRDI